MNTCTMLLQWSFRMLYVSICLHTSLYLLVPTKNRVINKLIDKCL